LREGNGESTAMTVTIRTTYRSPGAYDEISNSAARYGGKIDGMEEVIMTDAIGGRPRVFKTDVTFQSKANADKFFEARTNGVEYARL
jgi:hypothetical protein